MTRKSTSIGHPYLLSMHAMVLSLRGKDKGQSPGDFLQRHLTMDCTLNLMVNRLNARIHHSSPHWLGFKTQTTVRGMAQ